MIHGLHTDCGRKKLEGINVIWDVMGAVEKFSNHQTSEINQTFNMLSYADALIRPLRRALLLMENQAEPEPKITCLY